MANMYRLVTSHLLYHQLPVHVMVHLFFLFPFALLLFLSHSLFSVFLSLTRQ